MATKTVEQATVQEDGTERDESLKPITQAVRALGSDAAAEQRELLALILRSEERLSGFALRGVLVRILDLSDLMAVVFEDGWTEPFELASRLHSHTRKCCDVSRAIREEAEAGHD